jgi:hypothetical protein
MLYRCSDCVHSAAAAALAHTRTNNSVTGIAVDAKGDAIICGYVTNAAGNEDFFAQKVLIIH